MEITTNKLGQVEEQVSQLENKIEQLFHSDRNKV
jgi:hypothetical protein